MQPINTSKVQAQLVGLGTLPSQRASYSSPSLVVGVREKVPSPTDSELQKVIAISNAALKQVASSLEFSQDKSTGKALVRVYDRDTKELIRQFPTEEMVAVAEAINNFKGFLIDQKA